MTMLPIKTPASPHSKGFRPLTAPPPIQTTLPSSILCIYFIYFIYFSQTGVNWNLHVVSSSQGEDRAAGWKRATFRPEDRLLLRWTHLLPCQNRMQEKIELQRRPCSHWAHFVLILSRKKYSRTAMKTEFSPTFSGQPVNSPAVLLWKWHTDFHITQCLVWMSDRPLDHQNSMRLWFSVAKGRRFT